MAGKQTIREPKNDAFAMGGPDCVLSALTFDMRGGRKWAKPACGRPLDGRVRPHSMHVLTSGSLAIRLVAERLSSGLRESAFVVLEGDAQDVLATSAALAPQVGD
jgi:hypothetical protein